MHATTRQLIALRDREPVDAEVRAHVDACAVCRDALLQLRALRDALRDLPDEVPPAGGWQRIEARWAEEQAARQRPMTWLALAASVAIAAVVTWQFAPHVVLPGDEKMPTVTEGGRAIAEGGAVVNGAANGNARPEPSLASLQQRSHYLEDMLTAVSSSGGRVTSLSTAGTVSELEDSIALIDARLAAAEQYPLTDNERRYLWQQRIELLESLVTVRYAQARANSI